MVKTIHPSMVSLARSLAIVILPMIIYLALTSPKAILPLLLFTLLSVLFLWQSMAVSIVINTDIIAIQTLGCRFEEKLNNLYPIASKKFFYKQDKHLGLKKRFNGANLQGFRVGWFTLNNGDVGFACLTRKRRARALATRDGVYVLLDPNLAKQVELLLS